MSSQAVTVCVYYVVVICYAVFLWSVECACLQLMILQVIAGISRVTYQSDAANNQRTLILAVSQCMKGVSVQNISAFKVVDSSGFGVDDDGLFSDSTVTISYVASAYMPGFNWTTLSNQLVLSVKSSEFVFFMVVT